MQNKKAWAIVVIFFVFITFLTACSAPSAKNPSETSNDNSYINGEDIDYSHKLTLQSRFPGASKNCEIVIYTDNPSLTFDQVAKSLYSSSYEDSKLISEYQFVSFKPIN